MPKLTPEKKDDGGYASAGLNEKQFNQLFNLIDKAQKKNRRNAKRTLKPSTFTNPTPKALKALGEKAKGQRFTKDDLVKFDKARQRHKEKYDAKTAGITYAFLVKNSREIDIKRANNRVDDGSGINKATFIGVKNNMVLIRVKASSISKHDDHRVKVRFEQWDELLQEPPNGDYNQAAQLACSGRISFDCDCGRHQYWYRYLATMGNYCVAPPKEFAFPKIKNPELSGVACKHVLKATTMLQSIAWQRIIANQMKQQARRVSFGSDNKMHLLTPSEKKEAAKNRKTNVDLVAAQKEHAKYLRAQKAMEKAVAKRAKNSEVTKKQAKKIRKLAGENKKKEDKIKQLEARLRELEREKQTTKQNRVSDLAKQGADLLKLSFSAFNDAFKMMGKTQGEALEAFAKEKGLSVSQLEKIIK